MRVTVALVALSAVLAAVLGALSSAPPSEGLYYSGFVGHDTGAGELVCRVVLVTPYPTNFTLYYTAPRGGPVEVSVLSGGEKLFARTVPAGGRAELGVLEARRPGWALVEARVSGAGSLEGCGLEIAAGARRSAWWALYYAALLLLLLPPLLAGPSLVFGAWTREWLPWTAGSLVAAGLAYYHGAPAPLALEPGAAAFEAYHWVAFRLEAGVRMLVAVLSVVLGSMAAFYPRGAKWEYGELLTGSWGPRRVAARLLLGSLALSLSFLGGMVSLLMVLRVLPAVGAVGGLGVLLWYVARDMICVFLVSLGLGALFAGLSLATRSPSLVMVAGLILAVTVLSPPCSLGQGGSYVSSAGAYSYDLAASALLAPARWALAAAGLGLVAGLVGWARR